jgi:hypothetical protein
VDGRIRLVSKGLGQRVANSPVVGVEREQADSGYSPRVLPAPASTAHGHGRVGAADYLIQCRYDHGSKDHGPGRRCRQRWRPLRGPANSRPDIPASCNRSGHLSSGALVPVRPGRGVAGVGSTRVQLSTPVTERFSNSGVAQYQATTDRPRRGPSGRQRDRGSCRPSERTWRGTRWRG